MNWLLTIGVLLAAILIKPLGPPSTSVPMGFGIALALAVAALIFASPLLLLAAVALTLNQFFGGVLKRFQK